MNAKQIGRKGATVAVENSLNSRDLGDRLFGRLMATDAYPEFYAFLMAEMDRIYETQEDHRPELASAVMRFGATLLAITLLSSGGNKTLWTPDFERSTGSSFAALVKDMMFLPALWKADKKRKRATP